MTPEEKAWESLQEDHSQQALQIWSDFFKEQGEEKIAEMLLWYVNTDRWPGTSYHQGTGTNGPKRRFHWHNDVHGNLGKNPWSLYSDTFMRLNGGDTQGGHQGHPRFRVYPNLPSALLDYYYSVWLRTRP